MNPENQTLHRISRFLSDEIWDIELSSIPRLKRFGINVARVIHLVFNGFRDNECQLHAAALTYTSLMAIVPILALGLAVLRGLGAGEIAEQKIVQSMAMMPEQFQAFVSDILNYVRNTNFTRLGGIGLVLLLVFVIQMLGRVEWSFNRVWGVHTSRHLLRKISDYLSILMVVPLLVIAATTLNATFMSQGISSFIQERFGYVQFFFSWFLSLTPLFATWIAFIFLYKYMPNTRVHAGPAIVSGITGGSLWIGWQWLYINFQIGISHYNAIYATMASVLIFLFWLYISWHIVLLGAEIGFALQNHSTYNMEQRAHDASAQSRMMLALSITSYAARAMMNDVPRFEISSYAREYVVPVRLINEVVEELIKADLLIAVADSNGCFVLAKVPDMIKVKDVMNIIFQSGSSAQSLGLDRLSPKIGQVLERIDAGTSEALQDFNIADFLQLKSNSSEPVSDNSSSL